MSKTHSRTREIGTALAVLAIYLLTILAPMHHARASQLAFEELGYVTLDAGWALCIPLGSDPTDEGQSQPAKCPAAGVGKIDFAGPPLAGAPLDLPLLVVPDGKSRAAIPEPAPASPPSGSRAPPTRV